MNKTYKFLLFFSFFFLFQNLFSYPKQNSLTETNEEVKQYQIENKTKDKLENSSNFNSSINNTWLEAIHSYKKNKNNSTNTNTNNNSNTQTELKKSNSLFNSNSNSNLNQNINNEFNKNSNLEENNNTQNVKNLNNLPSQNNEKSNLNFNSSNRETSNTNNENKNNTAPSLLSALIRFVIFIIFFIFVLLFSSKLIRKKFSKTINQNDSDIIQILANVPLGIAGKYLQIIDVAGSIIVLGISETQINLVSNITDANVANRIRIWHAQKPKNIFSQVNQSNSQSVANTYLGKLTAIIKNTDFNFWSDNINKNNGNIKHKKQSFMETLNELTTGIPKNDNFNNQTQDAEKKIDTEELTKLLRKQKKKLKEGPNII